MTWYSRLTGYLCFLDSPTSPIKRKLRYMVARAKISKIQNFVIRGFKKAKSSTLEEG
jgi:hypothetical protein